VIASAGYELATRNYETISSHKNVNMEAEEPTVSRGITK
jgi:hypothetical protein